MAELSDQQQRAADLLSTRPDLTKEAIAAAVGVTRQTLYEWQKLPAFAREVKAAIRQIVPVESHRKILDALVRKAESGDPRAVEAYLKWQLETGAYANIAPEPADTGPPVINFIIKDDDEIVIDGGKLKMLAEIIVGYLANLEATRDNLRKELRAALPEETLAMLPVASHDKLREELRDVLSEETPALLPEQAKPDLGRILSPYHTRHNEETRAEEEEATGVITHTGETGVIYIQGPKETEGMFWERVNKNEAFESMRQR